MEDRLLLELARPLESSGIGNLELTSSVDCL